jgi:hypothetical protein
MLMTAPLDKRVCVLSSEEFKKFEEQVGVKPCEACDGPDCGNCKVQLDSDAYHMVKWVDGLKQAGFVPSDKEIAEELERYVYSEDTLLINEAAARARKGL